MIVKIALEVKRAQWEMGNVSQQWWCTDLNHDKLIAKVDTGGFSAKEGTFRWVVGPGPMGETAIEGCCVGNAPSDRQARREASAVLRARGFAVSSLLKGDML